MTTPKFSLTCPECKRFHFWDEQCILLKPKMTARTPSAFVRKKEIFELKNQNYTYEQIGNIYGITKQRVEQILNNKKFEGSRDMAREKIRDRDNHTCQICGKEWKFGQRKFDIHHLDEQINGKINTKNLPPKYDRENPDKLITLCHYCHLNLHWGNLTLKPIFKNVS